MTKESYVTVRAMVDFTVYVHRARQEGMTGRRDDVALDVVNGSEGAMFDNMVVLENITDAQVVA
jgi:hypothetical protein